jgi:ATP-binding cassette subfamily F protein 2
MAAREVPIPDHIDIFFLEEEFRKSDMNAIEGVIHSVQEEMKRLEAEADRVLEEDGPEAELLLDLYARLDNMDPSTFESRAAALLTGLGFSPEMMNKATKDMSGGWRMRVSFRHGTHTNALRSSSRKRPTRAH